MEHAEAAADMVWSTLAAATVPSVESDIAQCFFQYDQEQESMEAMAAMFLPCLDADSNSSSACVNFDGSPYSWPQLGSIAPAQNYESCGFSGTDLAAIGVDLSTAPYANHSGDQMPVAPKRKSVSAATGSIKFRKGGKGEPVRDDDDTVHVDTQSSSSCTSEEGHVDGNARRSSKKAATRAGRGAATDPQSLYARKRRERINERLRILQNLIPNGTKVDISTMLEEAVQYVKFLQLQIKLLSSDDLWMYAPIAYNGVNISDLDLKLSVLQK